MYTLIDRKDVTPESVWFKIKAPEIAETCKAGQFVMLRSNEKGERIPLTIADWDPEEGWISVIFQKAGASTYELAEYQKGESLQDCAGPLGIPTHTENAGNTIVIGGGLGIAIATPVARAYKQAGNQTEVIIGARKAELVFNEDEIKDFADELYICTDDGSAGRKGFVTDQLQEMIDSGKQIDTVFCVGPPIMMKFVAKVTEPYNIKTIASLNTIMLDGTGMCGACRLTVGGETKFACVDGPDFDAHQVEWEETMARLAAYKDEEREAMILYKKEKECRAEKMKGDKGDN
ncbi:MAG: sulfide/dihydroorotate dehydrogenase-like FAD/NAD-binding protein [Candidatus Heimdallarchaeota archaeon]|nr:sulfide/dihydroorotate dehydrogenase-like FAD/NAD-binding protein [Candidatus Heimdallarchaeota archaeon]MCK4770479.1 sulfide/dihydroorotate dehydrogenase-like FAD/NAD-binding protein [Candidatus Heimdallarchaeota archaeon]